MNPSIEAAHVACLDISVAVGLLLRLLLLPVRVPCTTSIQ
jgi:hypothetical protein